MRTDGIKESQLVTIGIPSYNRPAMLRQAIESALGQDYPHLEVVVSDDASSDEEVKRVLEEYRRADSRLRYELHNENVGLVKNWQQCLAMATGDFWLALPNDDWLEPNAISKMVEAFDDDPAIGLVTCGRFEHSERGDAIIELPANGVVEGREFINHRLQGKCGFPPTELYRLDLVHDCGGYHDIGYAMDLMLELDVGVRAKVAYINEPLTHHGRHNETASVLHADKAMTTLVKISQLAPERYGNKVAARLRTNAIRGVYGRTLKAAMRKQSKDVRVGNQCLKVLEAPRLVRLKAGGLNLSFVQQALYLLRWLKRRVNGRSVS